MKKMSNENLNQMVEKMVEMRKMLGISRVELAKRTGLNQTLIRKLERGMDRAHVDDYMMIIDTLTMEMLVRDLLPKDRKNQ
ncbi:helix-turn-helix transcriptional regulator [Shouchella miscanthi]|uniref:Helix-turn-helix transcriptional regulator n=1 Tax=Shouchella miscanthi TaxID=2598861 RepID=A0ABU6NP93_9BACI|nr:helix-turn-helix transcriptional regulator [Shouchella miscanthi]